MLNHLEKQRVLFQPDLHAVLEQLRHIEDLTDRARLRGQISGIYRRYRAELLVTITSWAIKQTPGAQPTKFGITNWQKLTFKRSLNNDRLAELWCDPSRKPGDRGSLAISESVSAFAAQAFSIYTGALDSEPDQAQLEQLSVDMLEHDLGL